MKKCDITLFIKDKALMIITLLSFFGLIIYLIICAPDSGDIFYKTVAVKTTLTVSFYIFIYFVFISYKYLKKVKENSLYEVYNISKNRKKFDFSKMALLFTSAAIITVIFIIYNLIFCAKYKIFEFDYIIYITANCILNILLIEILAIYIGKFLVSLNGKILSYFMMILIVFLFSPVFQSIISEIRLYENIDLFFISKFLNIFPPGLSFMTNFNNGFSLLPYRWALILMYIFCFKAAIKLKGGYTSKKAFNVTSDTVIAIICLIIFAAPSSKILPDYSPQGSIQHDFYYYIDTSVTEDTENNQKIKQENINADFTVSKCSINMSCFFMLKSKAEFTIKAPSPNNEYRFTLYHGYNIKNIYNENGDKLKFERNNDYVIVYAKDIKTIVFDYDGSSAVYYSNMQGVCLPGNFPYYPVPGYKIMYDAECQELMPVSFDDPIDFTVKIDAPYSVYSNLAETAHNTFKGTGEGVTLVSGFLTQKELNGTIYIYSYLNDNVNDYIEQIADEAYEVYNSLPNASKSAAYSIQGKKVIILPNLNQGSNVSFLSDHILCKNSFTDEYKVLLEGNQDD